MRITKLYLLAPSVGLALLLTACHSDKPVAKVPAKQATAPAIAPDTIAAPKPAEAKAPEEIKPVVAPPPADPVADLIAKVEKEYQAGQDNFKAGNLEGAKVSFNRAFDLLMNTNLDLQSDKRLLQEYDKVLAGSSQIELKALEQNENATAQKSEPAPIDEINEVNEAAPMDPNVKVKAEAEIKATHSDLPLMLTDQVAGFINYFSTRGRGTLERGLVRSGHYKEMVQRVLKEEGVPQELIYLAQAESGFYPFAVSRAGARGMWQFMASRARGYGLRRNPWLDERQDPEKSTRAAAHHLKDLYNEFGDWYLAMAAYNSGPGTVQKAVKRTGYADFWELYKRNVLPKETRNYVPIILAVTIMAKNPAQYGLDSIVPEKPLRYDTLDINYPVDLRLAAQCLDVSASALQDLNPSLLRWTTPANQTFELRLPEGSKDKYLSAITAIPEDMRVWWRYHSVASGDTLSSVARVYHVTSAAIAKANNLEGEDLPASGKLVIPLAPGRRLAMEDGSYARRITRYKVRRGDTVHNVAENFGISEQMVRRWNHLKGDGLGGRRVLYLHLPVAPRTATTERVATRRPRTTAKPSKPQDINSLPQSEGSALVRHKVKPGETLYSIASLYKTTVAALQRDNRNVNPLRAGAVLVVRGAQ